MEESPHCFVDMDAVEKHCTSLHKAAAMNRCDTIVCLGCFIKALKVSSSLYRDIAIFFKRFFLQNEHTIPYRHTHT